MVKKKTYGRQGNHNHGESFTNPSALRVVEYFDAERVAQRDEYFRQEKASLRSPKQPNKKPKPKAMSFKEKLELTNRWLEETYPYLFAADDYVPLDHQLLRDLKADYKNNALKKSYPEDLVIKRAFCRYTKSLGYLECLKERAGRYNLKGEICGTVSKQEEEAAKKILITL